MTVTGLTGRNPEADAVLPNGISRRTLLKGGAAAGGLLLGSVAGARAGVLNGTADTVLRGGAIHTLDPRQPLAQALAISGGRIVYVGYDNGVAAHTGSGTTVVDLGGRAVLPGIHDGHMHPLSGGQSLTAPSLNYAQLQIPAFLDAIARLLAATQEDEPDGWLVVGEWDATAMNKTRTRATSTAFRPRARYS
jgi:predicted amidohydrolase YtcJ